jgi:hypothetical protein
MNNKSKRIRKMEEIQNVRSYDFKYLARLVQTEIYVLCRVRGHDIIKCP